MAPTPSEDERSSAGRDDPHSESESESEPESESESESESQQPKPISKVTAPPQPVKSTPAKRRRETDQDVKGYKRAKKEDYYEGDGVGAAEDGKKQPFQRVWSLEDEIVVLEGILEFAEEKGKEPAQDMDGFFNFIKKSLHFDVSLKQLKEKVRKLRKKFANSKMYSTSHDQKASDLANRIWGHWGGAKSSNGKERKNAEALVVQMEKTSWVSKNTISSGGGFGGGMEKDYLVTEGLNMVEKSKRVEMEEKWKKLHVAELELYLQRIELIRELTKLVLAAYD